MNHSNYISDGKATVIRRLKSVVAALVLICSATESATSQSNRNLETFFKKDIGLSDDQISTIRSGSPVTKSLRPRNPSEVFLFGAIYIHAAPESYFRLASDYERLRKQPGYLALGSFSTPPRLSDLDGFSLDSDDIKALGTCKPSECLIQLPAGSIEQLQRSIDWSSADANEKANQLLRKSALELVVNYQHEGNRALGIYNDKSAATNVPKLFEYMLSYETALPAYLPDFYHYLLSYPKDRPANVDNAFYWSKVKFGLKPTLRIVQTFILRGSDTDQVAYAFAEKQLYSSHYFETALNLNFCVRGSDEPKDSGFYLITTMASEQAGLTGPKGSVVRKAAVDKSVAKLGEGLTRVRSALEGHQ